MGIDRVHSGLVSMTNTDGQIIIHAHTETDGSFKALSRPQCSGEKIVNDQWVLIFHLQRPVSLTSALFENRSECSTNYTRTQQLHLIVNTRKNLKQTPRKKQRVDQLTSFLSASSIYSNYNIITHKRTHYNILQYIKSNRIEWNGILCVYFSSLGVNHFII